MFPDPWNEPPVYDLLSWDLPGRRKARKHAVRRSGRLGLKTSCGSKVIMSPLSKVEMSP